MFRIGSIKKGLFQVIRPYLVFLLYRKSLVILGNNYSAYFNELHGPKIISNIILMGCQNTFKEGSVSGSGTGPGDPASRGPAMPDPPRHFPMSGSVSVSTFLCPVSCP